MRESITRRMFLKRSATIVALATLPTSLGPATPEPECGIFVGSKFIPIPNTVVGMTATEMRQSFKSLAGGRFPFESAWREVVEAIGCTVEGEA